MSASAKRGVAIVTGAARGIGLGIARVLGAVGLDVALTDIDGEGVEQSAADLRGAGHVLRTGDGSRREPRGSVHGDGRA